MRILRKTATGTSMRNRSLHGIIFQGGMTMIKTLAAQIKEYKKVSVMTPVFMVLEVVFEMLIPFLMASIGQVIFTSFPST